MSKYLNFCSKIILFNLMLFNSNFVLAEDNLLDELGSGLSEKGMYIDFLREVNSNNKLGIRVNYLPQDFLTHKNIYIEDRKVKSEYFGLGLIYQYKLLPPKSRSNFYLQANVDISAYRLFHKIDLTKETRTAGPITAECDYCGNLTIQTNPKRINIIPSLGIGYQLKNTEKLKTNIFIGMQFIEPGSLENFNDSSNGLPPWLQARVDNWVKKTEDKINSYSNLQPTINIGFNYSF